MLQRSFKSPFQEAHNLLPSSWIASCIMNDVVAVPLDEESYCEEKDTRSEGNEERELSIEEQASPLSRVLLLYLNELFHKGSRQPLEQQDLGNISKIDECNGLFNKCNVLWQEELKVPKARRSLWKCLWRTVGYDRLLFAIFLHGLYAASSFGPILILTELVRYFIGVNPMSDVKLWTLTSCLLVVPMIG